ncbi:MAG TPA: LacI family transcriptional regulator [Lachnoclostridium sp.]|uniref:LacI family DNA-binding transcriptional regulator n=1 Tax=Lacrimispora sp. TaxID=2719234 RepID=UPI000EE6B8CB|nr:LacI family DNA-binding transcriptional regulator [Lacrimispora sp.]HCD45659.1 LacI family transcriptional regulator [Lachnoclostridium sp.]
MITLKEIAAEAGVSMTTVSNVLHGKTKKVSPELEEKIKKLLVKYNYIPRFGLNALTNKGSKIISILVNTPEFVERTPYERPFYGNIIGELERMLRKRGYYIMLFSSKSIPEIMKMTMGWNVDGIISISMPVKYYKQIGKQTGKPIVSIDMNEYDIGKISDCFNVTSRDYEGGMMMMEYLLDQGIEKVVYLANIKSGADYCRYIGASEVYKERMGDGAELEIRMLGRTYDERVKDYDDIRRLIGRKAALFFSTDFNAVEAIGFFQRRQIHIPEDISIVGFDDDVYARLCNPRLTSMSVDVSQKAELAVNMLMRLLDGEEIKEMQPKVDAIIVERESVKKNG